MKEKVRTKVPTTLEDVDIIIPHATALVPTPMHANTIPKSPAAPPSLAA